MPSFSPGDKGEENDACEKERFICKGVHEGSKLAALVVVAGKVAIKGIAKSGDNEYPHRPVADGFVGRARFDTFTIIDSEHGKDRRAKESAECDFRCQRHGGEFQMASFQCQDLPLSS